MGPKFYRKYGYRLLEIGMNKDSETKFSFKMVPSRNELCDGELLVLLFGENMNIHFSEIDHFPNYVISIEIHPRTTLAST